MPRDTFFEVFSAWVLLHALRVNCDWHSKDKKKIPQIPKVDLA